MLFLSVGMEFFLGRTKKETGFLLKACLFFCRFLLKPAKTINQFGFYNYDSPKLSIVLD